MENEIVNFSQIDVMLRKLLDGGIDLGKNILAAIVIYFVGRWIIKMINRFVAKSLEKRKLAPEVSSFVSSLVNILLMIMLILSVIGALGIQMTSFAALLASAGVAVGMALSGNLQNFAGGLVILLLRPYRIGDFIEVSGVTGTVKSIQIFSTVLVTPDNKTIIIPNNSISSGVLVNYSHEDTRRVDLVFGVDYGTDIKTARETLVRLVMADTRVLKNPDYFIGVDSLGDSSVNIVVKMWVNSADYWDLYYDFQEKVYNTFNAEGINFPFPQLTVHQAK